MTSAVSRSVSVFPRWRSRCRSARRHNAFATAPRRRSTAGSSDRVRTSDFRCGLLAPEASTVHSSFSLPRHCEAKPKQSTVQLPQTHRVRRALFACAAPAGKGSTRTSSSTRRRTASWSDGLLRGARNDGGRPAPPASLTPPPVASAPARAMSRSAAPTPRAPWRDCTSSRARNHESSPATMQARPREGDCRT